MFLPYLLGDWFNISLYSAACGTLGCSCSLILSHEGSFPLPNLISNYQMFHSYTSTLISLRVATKLDYRFIGGDFFNGKPTNTCFGIPCFMYKWCSARMCSPHHRGPGSIPGRGIYSLSSYYVRWLVSRNRDGIRMCSATVLVEWCISQVENYGF